MIAFLPAKERRFACQPLNFFCTFSRIKSKSAVLSDHHRPKNQNICQMMKFVGNPRKVG